MNNVYFFGDILIATEAWDHHVNVQYTGDSNVQYTGDSKKIQTLWSNCWMIKNKKCTQGTGILGTY